MKIYIRNLLLFIGVFAFSFMNVMASIIGIGTKESGNDAVYTLEGKADIFLVDDQGRSSGYKNGRSVEEIPGVRPTFIIGGNNENRKQIYMPKRLNLTVVIVGKSNESYNLLVAGGNYYLKLEGVETKKGEIDEIISREDSVEINFDNNKKGKYNLSMDHFGYKNGSIYYGSVKSIGDIQKYVIDWNKVNNRKKDSVERSKEKDNKESDNQYGIIAEEDKYKTIEENKYEETTYLWIIIGSGCIILFVIGGLYYKNKINRLYIFIIGTIFIVIIGVSLFFGEKQDKIYDCVIAGDEIKEIGKIYDGKGNFEIKSGKVYKKIYQEGIQGIRIVDKYDLKVTNIDAESFRMIGYGYTKDSKNIYHHGLKLKGVNYCSFELYDFGNRKNLSTWMAKDKNNVIFNGKSLNNIDVDTFEKVGFDFFKDKDNVFNGYFEVVKTADAETFTYDDKKYFAYDKNGVYVNNETYIKGADGESFEKIGGYFYKDNKNVYYKSNILEQADTTTFEEISYEYYKDKDYIYYKGGKILEGADSETFTKYGKFYYDINGIYPEKNFFIPGADINSFKDLNGGYYIDNRNAYYINKYFKGGDRAYILNIINDVDIKSFKKLSNWYAKDDKNVYYLGLIVEGVDVASFSTLRGKTYTKDKNNVYYERKIIKNSDPDTFQYIGGKLSVDKNNAYSQGIIIEGVESSMCKSWTECKTNYPQKKSFFN